MLTTQAPKDRSLAVDTHRYSVLRSYYFTTITFFTVINYSKQSYNHIVTLTTSTNLFF